MPHAPRLALALSALLAGGLVPSGAQEEDRPAPLAPSRPRTKQELDRREALKLYAQGLVCQREDRLLEAVANFEKALQLDPEAVPVLKALIPLYQALERGSDTLAACQKVLRLKPGDYETWAAYARQLKTVGRAAEARAALTRGLACKGVKKRPDLQYEMAFELGILHEQARDFRQAAEAFSQAVAVLEKREAKLETGPFDLREIDARIADLYERVGRLAMQARRYDEAVAAFRKAQTRAKDRAGRLNYNLAEVCQAQGKYEEALKYVEAYLQLQPQGMEAYELKIRLLKQLKRPAAILPALRAYAARDKYNQDLQLLLARQYTAEGQADRAETIYLEQAGKAPAPDVYRGLFQLYKNTRQMRKVLLALNGALETAGRKDAPADKAAAARRARVMLVVLRDDADLVKALLTAARQYLREDHKLAFETCRFLAVLAGRAQQLQAAERFYRLCLDEATADNEPGIYAGLLQVLWQARKYQAIVDVCNRGLARPQSPNHVMFELDLALALATLDRMDEALTHADKAVELALEPNKLYVRLRRVSILTRAEHYDKAIAECRALLKDHTQPGDVHDIRYTLSNVYSAAQKYKEAEEELGRVLKLSPDDATAYNDLGYIWADQNKNLAEAEAYIRKALELDRQQKKSSPTVQADADRDNAAYIDSLGWVLFRRGKLEEARRELEKAVSLPDGGDDPVVWDHLGDVYFRLEQSARARRAWQKAVTLYEVEKRRKMDHRYEEIKQKLKQLEHDTHP